jgi:hypothetical protein
VGSPGCAGADAVSTSLDVAEQRLGRRRIRAACGRTLRHRRARRTREQRVGACGERQAGAHGRTRRRRRERCDRPDRLADGVDLVARIVEGPMGEGVALARAARRDRRAVVVLVDDLLDLVVGHERGRARIREHQAGRERLGGARPVELVLERVEHQAHVGARLRVEHLEDVELALCRHRTNDVRVADLVVAHRQRPATFQLLDATTRRVTDSRSLARAARTSSLGRERVSAARTSRKCHSSRKLAWQHAFRAFGAMPT